MNVFSVYLYVSGLFQMIKRIFQDTWLVGFSTPEPVTHQWIWQRQLQDEAWNNDLSFGIWFGLY